MTNTAFCANYRTAPLREALTWVFRGNDAMWAGARDDRASRGKAGAARPAPMQRVTRPTSPRSLGNGQTFETTCKPNTRDDLPCASRRPANLASAPASALCCSGSSRAPRVGPACRLSAIARLSQPCPRKPGHRPLRVSHAAGCAADGIRRQLDGTPSAARGIFAIAPGTAAPRMASRRWIGRTSCPVSPLRHPRSPFHKRAMI